MREKSTVGIDEAQKNRKDGNTTARGNVPMGEGVEHVALRMPGPPPEGGNLDDEGSSRRTEKRDASPSELRRPSALTWPSTLVGKTRTGTPCRIMCCVPTAIATAASCVCATCARSLCCDRTVTEDCCHSARDKFYDCKECMRGFGRGCVELPRSLAPLVLYEAISEAFSAFLAGCFMRYVWGVLCRVLRWPCCACGRGDEHC